MHDIINLTSSINPMSSISFALFYMCSLPIRMQSAEDFVGKEGQEGENESKRAEQRRAHAAPVSDIAGVKIRGVDKKDHQ